MGNRDKYFKGQQENEELICFLRHHWIYLIKEFLYFSILILVTTVTITYIDQIITVLQGNKELKLFFLTGYGIATYAFHRFFLKIFNFFVNVGIITNLRFTDHQKSLFFKDNIDSIDMGNIQNIERIEKGILPNILGYGDLKIYLTAASGVKRYNLLPNVKFHFRCLSRQKERRQYEIWNQREQQNITQTTSTAIRGHIGEDITRLPN